MIPWPEARARLAEAFTHWLATSTRTAGRRSGPCWPCGWLAPTPVVVFGFGNQDDRDGPRSTRWQFAQAE